MTKREGVARKALLLDERAVSKERLVSR